MWVSDPLPSPRVLFSRSCLACSLEMRLLPSRNSRNFCGEFRVITRADEPSKRCLPLRHQSLIRQPRAKDRTTTGVFLKLYRTMSIFRQPGGQKKRKQPNRSLRKIYFWRALFLRVKMPREGIHMICTHFRALTNPQKYKHSFCSHSSDRLQLLPQLQDHGSQPSKLVKIQCINFLAIYQQQFPQ